MSDKPGRKVSHNTGSDEPDDRPVSTPGFKGNFPTLWKFLAKRRDLGETHQTGCITLFVDGEKIKLCINDRPTRQSSFVSGSSLLEALARAERGIKEGSLTWTRANYKRRTKVQVNRRTPLLDA